MQILCLLLIPVAFAIALPIGLIALRLGTSLGALDSAPRDGQVKRESRAVPNTGGVAIFAGVALPIVIGLIVVHLAGEHIASNWPALNVHLPGIRDRTPLAAFFLGCLLVLHIVGLIDDRKPLGAAPKLVVMFACAAAVASLTNTRLLTVLDGHVGGPWLSVVITVLWLVLVTNTMNFMDNMDGLSAGVAAMAGACFLGAALLGEQWFVAAVLALLVGSCCGFLVLNAPPARIFMGDGGSLVIGFVLAFLTVRTTYFVGEGEVSAGPAGGWHAVFMPLVVLAVPLYDFVSVTAIRLSQGRSPFVGDLQHLSHRLMRRGLSERATLVVVCGLTAVTGLSGILLAYLEPWQAILVAVQIGLILVVIAIFEFATSGRTKGVGP